MDDDFEEIVRTARALAPCTIRCVALGRHAKKSETVSVTFRSGGLDEEVNAVLRAAVLACAYSPSQRAVRITDKPEGKFQLSRAPRANDVFLLRFPKPANLPWFGERYEVAVDVNPAQKSIFLDLTPIFEAAKPKHGATALLPAPPKQLAAPNLPTAIAAAHRVANPLSPDEDGRVTIPADLEWVPLTREERHLLWMLSNGAKVAKDVAVLAMESAGLKVTSINTVCGNIDKALLRHNVEITHSTDKRTIWLTPMAKSALWSLLRG